MTTSVPLPFSDETPRYRNQSGRRSWIRCKPSRADVFAISSSVISVADRRAAAAVTDAGAVDVGADALFEAHPAKAERASETASDLIMSEDGIGNAFSPSDPISLKTVVRPEPTGRNGMEGRMWRRAFVPVVGLLLAACATSTNGAPSSRYSLTSRDVITAAEIVASRVTDAYQAVTQLRPNFLRRRATPPGVVGGNASVAVYLDDLFYGGVESLRQIPLERVRVIRFITPMSADVRYGGSHPSGAILVTTLPERRR